MADSASLLRLLEPAVRPVDGGKSAPSAKPSFDAEPFEDLLARADALMREAAGQTSKEGGEGLVDPASDAAAGEQQPKGPLAPLADLSAIESASLRDMVAQRTNEATNENGSAN